MNGFWRRWLAIWCVGVAMFGLVLIGGAFPATAGPALALLELLNGPEALEPGSALDFALAVLGAVSLGWALTLWAAIRAADALGPAGAPIWRLVTGSVVCWYVVDSALSVATGFALNVVPNTVLAGGFLAAIVGSGVLARARPAAA